MKTLLLFICLCVSINIYSQAPPSSSHNVKVEIDLNAFMCPNLGMKIKRTLIIRKNDMTDWKTAPDNNSAVFKTTNASLCNKDSILKIFVKESEFPMHIIKSIQIDGLEVYKKTIANK